MRSHSQLVKKPPILYAQQSVGGGVRGGSRRPEWDRMCRKALRCKVAVSAAEKQQPLSVLIDPTGDEPGGDEPKNQVDEQVDRSDGGKCPCTGQIGGQQQTQQ